MLDQAIPAPAVTTSTLVHGNGKIHWLGVVLTGLVVVYIVVQTAESWKNIKAIKSDNDDHEKRLLALEDKVLGLNR